MPELKTQMPTVRLLSWNMGAGGPGPRASWTDVVGGPYDAALLQEAPNPWGLAIELDVVPRVGSRWGIDQNRARTAIARISERVRITPYPTRALTEAGPRELGVSRPGTVTVAAMEIVATGETLLLASVYGQWEGPATGGAGIFADASMHRLLSDLSPLLSWPESPVILAGDFNCVLGGSEDSYGGNWNARHEGVFRRLEDLGLRLAGPQHPNGNQAQPRPATLPENTKNVPTFRTNRGNCVNQLDYCYVSKELADRVSVRALNSVEDWGPSDHCRVAIEVAPPHERFWTEAAFLAELAASQGPEPTRVAADLFSWAHRQGLRLELSRGDDGQCWAQLDAGPEKLQWTFSVRTRGDVVVQFQYMSAPYRSLEARAELAAALSGYPQLGLTPDRVGGRPAFSLRHLIDDGVRGAFLDVFTTLVRRTRDASAV